MLETNKYKHDPFLLLCLFCDCFVDLKSGAEKLFFTVRFIIYYFSHISILGNLKIK